jgi:hypothetical protein
MANRSELSAMTSRIRPFPALDDITAPLLFCRVLPTSHNPDLPIRGLAQTVAMGFALGG